MPNSSAEGGVLAEPRRSRRGPWKWALRLGLGALIVFLVARTSSDAPVWPALRRVPPQVLAFSVAGYWFGQLLSTWRWRLVINALRSPSSPALRSRECLRFYAVGMFWSLFMPTGVGGDAVRSVLAGRRAGGLSQGAASVLLDRVIGLVILLCVGACALVWQQIASPNGPLAVPLRRAVVVMAMGAALVAITVLGLWLWQKRAPARSHGDGTPKSRGRMAKVAELVSTLREALALPRASSRARLMAVAVLFSLGVQLCQITINVGLALAVGMSLSWADAAWVVPALALSSLLPLGIGGLGMREAAAVALLGGVLEPSRVLAWSLLGQATVWLASLCGAPFAIHALDDVPKAKDD
jgi:uncharacterized protein (TIRG00374 family)